MLQLKKMLGDAAVFDGQVLNWITEENLWNIWVSKQYGGLELSLREGLNKLQSLARLDGSLGWTITLCSGANYFIGNLQPETAKEIFTNPAIFGGSGGMFGTAEKLGGNYKLNGTWRYATGAPYLTHFTLNAKIIENGKEQINDDGSPKFLSFVIPANQVSVIEDWNTMGLKASATHSFEVKNVLVDERYSFVYNTFYLEQPVFKIHFSVFADLTLWVNYIGMAEHLLEEASLPDKPEWKDLQQAIYSANEKAYDFAKQIENLTGKEEVITKSLINEVHQSAVNSVKELSKAIISVYPYAGVKGSRESHELNQIFRDYFTATQHHIFTK
ncbi:acyl-CoA dehydrogenase [Owenweeksia hongkongensis]|uniref:acyl-CoA dehydrogenase n=1 Tax=Owenweeksia hongkongensis TaxID=253245 RepID=UPI003A90FF52